MPHNSVAIAANASSHGFSAWDIIVPIAILLTIVCIIILRKALNKIAFGRSMFIFLSSIFMGLLIGFIPSLTSTILAWVFFILGYAFLILMTFKSLQHLNKVKRQLVKEDPRANLSSNH